MFPCETFFNIKTALSHLIIENHFRYGFYSHFIDFNWHERHLKNYFHFENALTCTLQSQNHTTIVNHILNSKFIAKRETLILSLLFEILNRYSIRMLNRYFAYLLKKKNAKNLIALLVQKWQYIHIDFRLSDFPDFWLGSIWNFFSPLIINVSI